MTGPGGDDDLSQLPRVETADIFKAGRPAATLTRTPHGIEFRYLSSWVKDGGPPVASTLPVVGEPTITPAGGLPAYFAGLLPEGRRLGALRRAVKTSADDELSLLLAVGADAIGDVQVVPAGTTPDEVPARIEFEPASPAPVRFRDLLAELGIRAQRMALPGVQEKTSAAMINLPVSRAGERFILKLNPIGEFPHLVANEAFFLDAATTSGLRVPPHETVIDVDGEPGLLIRRFDRVTVDGHGHMLAVEDACQACDLPPAEKYRVSTDFAFGALAALCDAPLVAARELLRQVAFAYLTGNGDAHAKNFSVLQAVDGEWRVSPAYDLPSSYLSGDTTMAMTIGERRGPDLVAADFVGLGSRLGVTERSVRRTLDELAQRSELWLGDLDALPFDPRQLHKLRRLVGYRRDRLAHRSVT